jgi:hypothetical protein
MLDMKQPQQMLNQLKEVAETPKVDPTLLPLELARAKLDVENSIGGIEREAWWSDASSAGLVQAGLIAVARWLNKSGV